MSTDLTLNPKNAGNAVANTRGSGFKAFWHSLKANDSFNDFICCSVQVVHVG